jgi:hypothetical protein
VARVIRVPLAALCDEARWERAPHAYRGAIVRIWQFVHDDDVIWGATGSMLHGMVQLLR